MIIEKLLESKNLYYRSLTLTDVSEYYLKWLQDVQIIKYLETRFEEQTLEKIADYVTFQNNSEHSVLLAIVSKESGLHIGNIKIGPINYKYNFADISYFIGNKSYWGKGLATESIRRITSYGFSSLKLYRCQSGVFENNIASRKSLEKAGYIYEGSYRKKLVNWFGEREDHLLYGVLADEWID